MAKKKSGKKAAKKVSKKSGKSMAKPLVGKGKKPEVRIGGMVVRRGDLGADVSTYFGKLDGWKEAVARRLDAVVRASAPSATAAIKWGMPVYEHHGMLCYIRVRPAYVTFGFYETGTSLDDPKGLLEGSGEAMRHVKIASEAEMDAEYFGGLVGQAARLNEGT
jgi:hypothetical protein